MYDPQRARAVAIHGSTITQALRKIYDPGALADALEGKVAVGARWLRAR